MRTYSVSDRSSKLTENGLVSYKVSDTILESAKNEYEIGVKRGDYIASDLVCIMFMEMGSSTVAFFMSGDVCHFDLGRAYL